MASYEALKYASRFKSCTGRGLLRNRYHPRSSIKQQPQTLVWRLHFRRGYMHSTSEKVYLFTKQNFLVSCPRNNEYILVRRVKRNHHPSNLEVRLSPAEPCPKKKRPTTPCTKEKNAARIQRRKSDYQTSKTTYQRMTLPTKNAQLPTMAAIAARISPSSTDASF